MEVGHLPLLARLSGTLCPRTCGIRRFLRTVAYGYRQSLKTLLFAQYYSVFSALEVFLRQCAILILSLTLTVRYRLCVCPNTRWNDDGWQRKKIGVYRARQKSNRLGKILYLWNCSKYIYQICRVYRRGWIQSTYPANFIKITNTVQQIQQFKL